MSEPEPILAAEGLVKSYEEGRVRALAGVDLRVARGEFLAVMGPSGCGKSTLLHLLGALDRPDEGRVLLRGRDLAAEPRLDRVRSRTIGFVFQMHHLVPALTVLENVELPLVPHGLPRRERRERGHVVLAAVGLGDKPDRLPDRLSGGERQRAAVARALVHGPEIVLADEPTGDLDRETGLQVIDLLARLRDERGLTLVLVTHDPDIAARADRTVRMLDGLLVP